MLSVNSFSIEFLNIRSASINISPCQKLHYPVRTSFPDTHTYRYGDFHPVNNRERLFAIAIMLSTYIAYGLILGRSAAILAGFNFRRQTFKQRFAIIRNYLVRLYI